MLRFLSTLFTPGPAEKTSGLDETLLQTAIERVVAGTDRRLRALRHYQERLREPVERAALHVIALVEALPAPVAISPEGYGEDPLLRTFFASPEHMREIFGRLHSLRDFLAGESPPAEIFGLLSLVREEHHVFAMKMENDTLRRDVMQVAVNFSNHRYLGPRASEPETRRELKLRAFDFLIERALERIMSERGKRREMDRQRHLLQQKLDAMRAGQFGLGPMLGEENQPVRSLAELEAEIDAIDQELGEIHGDSLGLEESLELVTEILTRPEDWLATRPVRLCLDYRGIKIEDASTEPRREIMLTELFSGTGESRTVLLGRIARPDIPAPPDFLKLSKRYV